MEVLTNVDCDEVLSSVPDDGQGVDEPTIAIVREVDFLDDDGATQRMLLVPGGLPWSS